MPPPPGHEPFERSTQDAGPPANDAVTGPPAPANGPARTPMLAAAFGPTLPVGATLAGGLDRYVIVGEIGQGGMGTVLRGRGSDGRQVAIKLLRPSIDTDRVARFEREASLLRRLGQTDGFVPLLDAGRLDPTLPFIVMPYVSGGTLRSRLRLGPHTIDEAFALGVALAEALGRAHRLGVVHRDLKPENVLFAPDGRPLITDLGLAKHFLAPDGASSVALTPLSSTGLFMGTFGYVAPEQMRDAASVGPGADVFSLAALLYECLAGAPPFGGESIVDVLRRIERGDVAPLRGARPEVPEALAAVIHRGLEHAVSERFPDGATLAAALRDAADGVAPLAVRRDASGSGVDASGVDASGSGVDPSGVDASGSGVDASGVDASGAEAPRSERGLLVPVLVGLAGVVLAVAVDVAVTRARSTPSPAPLQQVVAPPPPPAPAPEPAPEPAPAPEPPPETGSEPPLEPARVPVFHAARAAERLAARDEAGLFSDLERAAPLVDAVEFLRREAAQHPRDAYRALLHAHTLLNAPGPAAERASRQARALAAARDALSFVEEGPDADALRLFEADLRGR